MRGVVDAWVSEPTLTSAQRFRCLGLLRTLRIAVQSGDQAQAERFARELLEAVR